MTRSRGNSRSSIIATTHYTSVCAPLEWTCTYVIVSILPREETGEERYWTRIPPYWPSVSVPFFDLDSFIPAQGSEFCACPFNFCRTSPLIDPGFHVRPSPRRSRVNLPSFFPPHLHILFRGWSSTPFISGWEPFLFDYIISGPGWKVEKSDFSFFLAKRNFRILRTIEKFSVMNISLYDSLYIRQNCILSFRNVSIDSLKDLSIYIYIQKTFQFFIIQHEYYYNMKRRINCSIDHRSVNEGGEPVSSLRNYVKQWRKEEGETERERESSLFAALYVYWKIPEALFRSGKLVGEHPRQRLMRGMQFPRAARLSSDAPFPCTIFRAAPNSRICINTGDPEREFFGVRMLSWRKCAGNPIIHPGRNRSLGSSISIRPCERLFFPGEENNSREGGGTTRNWNENEANVQLFAFTGNGVSKRSSGSLYARWILLDC